MGNIRPFLFRAAVINIPSLGSRDPLGKQIFIWIDLVWHELACYF